MILGSAAIKNPYLVNEACVRFPGKIVVGIDARDGFVTAEGWAESSTVRATELALRVEDQGANAIIYTDVTRDGMKTGLNLTQTIEVAGNIKIDLIASGGIGSADDLKALALVASQKGKRNIRGVVVGRALYDGSIAVNDALIALRGSK